MSIKVMTHVWENSRHEGTELLAELSLADWSNDDGVCWPKLPRIAKRVRVKERQATNIIHKLEAVGTLFVQRGKGRISSRYLLTMGRSAAELMPVLMEYFRMDKGSATVLAMKLEVQSSTPLVQGCNPVQGRGAIGCTSEVQSSTAKQAESKGAVGVRKTDPSLNPSLNPNTSATGVAGTSVEMTLQQRVDGVRTGTLALSVGKLRNLTSDVIAWGAYGMNKGNRFTSVTANEVIKDQCGDTPTNDSIEKLAVELYAMYVWWTDGKHGLSNPTKSPTVISGLVQYREYLATHKPRVAQPTAPRPQMIEWIETYEGVTRPKLPAEFASDFKRSFMAPAPTTEAAHV